MIEKMTRYDFILLSGYKDDFISELKIHTRINSVQTIINNRNTLPVKQIKIPFKMII